MLKPKVQRFCEEYLKNGSNGTEAALAAGYGSRENGKGRHVAAQTASRLLRQDQVLGYIRDRAKEIYEQMGLSPERIAAEYWKLYQRSAEGSEILDREGNHTGVWAYDGKTAAACLKALGESMGMFQKQVRLDGSINDPLQRMSEEDLRRLIGALEKGEDA